MKLIDALPREFRLSYDDVPAYRHRDVEVVMEWHGAAHEPEEGVKAKRWPGPHKHVFVWYELENGYAVGWNENPGRGWSFPLIKLPISSSR